MPWTRRSRGSGRRALAHAALLFGACAFALLVSLTVLGGTQVQANPPSPPHGDGVHPGGGNGGLDNSGHTLHPNPEPPPPPPPDDPPDNPPPDAPPPGRGPPPAGGGGGSPTSAPTPTGINGVAGISASGESRSGGQPKGGSTGSVVVKPHQNPAQVSHQKAKDTKAP